ncbi:MAG: C25 family cysteine peptidase, partial [candidate division WOR-3 bacterium]
MNLINIILCFFVIDGNTIKIKKPDFKLIESGEYVILSFKGGTHDFSNPGEPSLPWKIFKIGVEIDKDAEINFEIVKTQEIETDKKVMPFPYFKNDGMEAIYKPDENKYINFPENNLLNLGIGSLRGRKCIILAYTPFMIRNKKLYLIEEAKIIINKKDKKLKGKYKKIKDYKIFGNFLDSKTSPYIKIFDSNLSFFERSFWIKLIIKEEGLYKITYEDIKNLGLEPSLYKINEIGIFSLFGERLNPARDSIHYLNPLPFSCPFIFKDIDNDGYFTEKDTLIFYSPSPKRRKFQNNEFSYYENPFSDEIIYFLALEKGGSEFMDTLNVSPTIWDKERNFCLNYYRHEKNLVNLGKRGFRWEGEDLSRISLNIESRTFDFNLEDIYSPDGKIRTEIVVLDSSANPDPVHVSYELNGNTIYSAVYPRTEYNTLRFFTSSVNNLKTSNNFKIILGTQGDKEDYLYLDFFEIEYKRILRTFNEIHIYDTTKGKILYKIYTTKKGYLLDVSDYKNPLFLKGWDYENDTLKFLIENQGDFKEFYFTQNLKKPHSIILIPSLKELRDTLNQADYIIITHKELISAVTGYLNYRKNNLFIGDSQIQNPRIKIVPVDKIYDEFGFGMPDFVSIRNFLAYTFYFWKEPKPLYVLLAGDGSYDYKNYTKSVKNYIPPTEWGEVFDPDAGGDFTYDIFYVQFDPPYNDPPDMIIGRIPAKNAGEILDYIERVHTYEREDINSTWRNKIMGVADDDRPESSLIFTYELRDFLMGLPKNIDFNAIYTAFYPFDYVSRTRPLSRKEFYEEIKKGYFLVFLWGHGNPYQIFHEKLIYLPADLSLLEIDFKRPLFFFGACKPSAFDRLEISVGEGFMITPNSGIATLGPSSLIGYGNYKWVLTEIMEVLYDYKIHTLGEIYISAGVPDKYILLGDPALIFNLPKPDINLTYQKSFLDTIMKGSMAEFIDTIEGEGRIKLEVFGNPRKKVDTTGASPNHPPLIDTIYIRPDNIFKGYFSLKNGIYHPIFGIPKFLSPQDTFGKLLVYYGGKGKGVVGIIDSIYFKEFDGSKIDTTKPKIKLYYLGKEIKDSTRIRKNDEIEIEIFDENGILIYGNERIKLKLEEEYDLTDYYICENDDPRKGRIKFKIPENITSGYKNLTVSAYDNFYNLGIETKIIYIEEEEKISIRCLPFPNPSKNKVYFGIETNENGKIDLKIYTLRGRLIYEKSGIYINKGFNKIEWNGKDRDGNFV